MKIKEKILKLGKRKNCFIALLLCALLLFAVLSGLNCFKSAETQVNALSAPTNKNLDLNGVRYTYQTSLNELKNKYNVLKNAYTQRLFTISQDAEGIIYYSVGGQNPNVQLNQEQINDIQSITKNAITFYDKNNNIVENNDYNVEGTSTQTNDIAFFYPTSFNLNDFKSINIDLNALFEIPEINSEYFSLNGGDYGDNGYFCSFLYLKNNIDATNNNLDYLKENSIYYSIFLSKITNEYNFNIKKYSGYNLKQIAVFFPDEQIIEKEIIELATPKEYKDFNEGNYNFQNSVAINNLEFIDTGYLNVIGAEVDYMTETTGESFYKGNILLSNDKFDNNLLEYVNGASIPARVVTQNIGQVLYFGGNFDNSNAVPYIKYSGEYTTKSMRITKGNEPINNLNSILYNCLSNTPFSKQKVLYGNQNQLLYIREMSDLTIKDNSGYTGAGLSAQVEDILYNVNYVGDIEEVEFNEKVQEDFENLIKLVGLGAFIGLLIGLVFGVPGLGALIGALIGLGAGLIPLIIDALQSIFGHNFLSGLYNFFKSITNFFVNIVDTVINFLLSIITNPFVLVLILIIVLIYIFVIRPKLK